MLILLEFIEGAALAQSLNYRFWRHRRRHKQSTNLWHRPTGGHPRACLFASAVRRCRAFL